MRRVLKINPNNRGLAHAQIPDFLKTMVQCSSEKEIIQVILG
jgi:hypothetical protein